MSYQRIRHSLDPEEEVFQKQLEMQGDDIDELFSFEDHGNLDFDDSDLEALDKLDALRAAEDGAAADAEDVEYV